MKVEREKVERKKVEREKVEREKVERKRMLPPDAAAGGPPVGTLASVLVGDGALPLRGPPVGTLASTLEGDGTLPPDRGPPVGDSLPPVQH